MSMSDPIADMLTRIRNACRSKQPQVTMPSSIVKVAIAEVLKGNGYVADYSVAADGVKKTLTVTLKYLEETPVIEGIRRISMPSRRVYVKSEEIPRGLGGLGIAVVSTSKGIMSDRAARKENLGGELLCYVW